MAKHIAVLMGGWSPEREVSLVSGKACAEGLREGGHSVVEYDVKRDLRALVDFLRPELKFDGLPALITQMDADSARSRAILAARRSCDRLHGGHPTEILDCGNAALLAFARRAPQGGMAATRPPAMDATTLSASAPHCQSALRRFGKPVAPPPSDPWHCAQFC